MRMIRGAGLGLLAALLVVGALAPARGAALPPDPGAPDLYMEAMEAINEGRRGDAGRALDQMLVKGPDNAGEWLDLAMIQCALGRAAQAEELFRNIEARFAPPPALRQLIAQQRASGCTGPRRQRDWSLRLSRGYDQNVNQGARSALNSIGDLQLELQPQYLPQADQFTALDGEYSSELFGNGDTGYVAFGSRRNDTQSKYDTVSLLAGLEHPMRWGRWRLRASLNLGSLMLGGHNYQQHAQAHLRAVAPLRLPLGWTLQLHSSVARLRYTTLDNFDANVAELRTLLVKRKDSHFWQLGLGWAKDRALASRPGGDRSGWNAAVLGRVAWTPKWNSELESHWQERTGELAYAPGFINLVRRQHTRTVRAALHYQLAPEHTVQVEWRHIRNNENLSIFRFDENLIQLGWRWHGH